MNLFFHIALIFLILFSFFVISSKNPIHSVLSLISVFLLSALLLTALGVEFLALSFVIVYVGAIAILFLFVVMMLDIKMGESSLGILNYGPLSLFLSFIFLLEISLPVIELNQTPNLQLFSDFFWINWCAEMHFLPNIQSVGQLLYTYYFIYFLMAGLILFIAALGSLMLTVTLNKPSRKQII